MASFALFAKGNDKDERRELRPSVLVSFDRWKSYIDNHPSFTWFIHTKMGQMLVNDPVHPLDQDQYYCKAILDCKPRSQDSYFDRWSDGRLIIVQFNRITVRRLEVLWQVAEDLDLDITNGWRIIDRKRFERILERYRPKSRKKEEK
jgi:hypothetical protein